VVRDRGLAFTLEIPNGICPVYDTKMTTESTNFMKEILVPNEIFSKKLERKILKIPYKDYTIIHYRLGDDEMNNNNEMKYEHLLIHFMKNYEQTDILLSVSLNYKIYISKNVKIFTYKNKIAHLGRNDNMNEIEHSIIELLILSRQKDCLDDVLRHHFEQSI
jgi:hypothetical protein